VGTTTLPLASASPPRDVILRDLHDQLLRCGEFMASQGGAESDGERQPPVDNGPWFPHSPDTKFWVLLRKVGELQSRVGTVELIDAQEWGITWQGDLPAEDPEQSGVWAVGGPYGPSPSNLRRQLAATVRLSADETPVGSDPRARCN
jgi:hypothetical protein